MSEEQSSTADWRIIGETVPGASHIRAGIPNQDAIIFVRESTRNLPVILSISDGHGSPKCFRSHRGSRFAVKKAAFLISEFLDERRCNFDPAEIENKKDFLAAEFVKRWREAVEADLRGEPFTELEFEQLEKKSDANARKSVEENPLIAYGATSLTVAVEENFVLYLQLGDGEILNVSEAGKVTKPLPEDARLLANETTSLCLRNAEQDFRFVVQKISADESPQMILLSTDGYLNSFSTEEGFFQAGTDILEMLKAENGFDAVNDNLKAWLEEATNLGSGDDCTVGIIYLQNKIQETEKEITTQSEAETSTEIDVPIDPKLLTSEEMEDVTVTITIKKDKNKKNRTAEQKSPPSEDSETSGKEN